MNELVRRVGLGVLLLVLVGLEAALITFDLGHRWVDGGLLVACLGVAVLLKWRADAGTWLGNLVWAIALSWVGISALRGASPQRLALAPARTSPVSNDAGLRVGLALSGGGYRAALLHAGVLSGLEAAGVPVTNISSVSGGSIIGSFYAAGGRPEEFVRLVAEGHFNLRRDLFVAHNMARLIVPRWLGAVLPFRPLRDFFDKDYDRVDLQSALLDRTLLGGMPLRSLADGNLQLMVCTTDLRSAALVGLSPKGYLFRAAPTVFGDPESRYQPWSAPKGTAVVASPISLSFAVALSGAFPGAFPARNVYLPTSDANGFYQVQLADGGIADNSGLALMQTAARLARAGKGDAAWALDLVLASDGGVPLERDSTDGFLDTLGRTMDVIHAMIASTPGGDRFVRLSPQEYLLPLTLMRTSEASEEAKRKHAFNIEPGNFDRDAVARLATVAHPSRQAAMTTAVQAFLAIPPAQLVDHRLPWWRILSCDPKTTRRLAPYIPPQLRGLLPPEVAPEVKTVMNDVAVLISADVCAAQSVFQRISTLDDQISAEDSAALFRLGQYLVFFKARDLKQATDAARQNKAKGAGGPPIIAADLIPLNPRVQALLLPEPKAPAAKDAKEFTQVGRDGTTGVLPAALSKTAGVVVRPR